MSESTSTSSIYQIEIGPYRKEATSNIEFMSLQAKGPGETQFSHFWTEIQGFTHVQGHHYVLEIEATKLPQQQIPADASDTVYRLIKVISDTVV